MAAGQKSDTQSSPGPHRLFILDLEYFIAAAAARRRHFGAVALALADQGARNRRGNGNLALAHIGFVLADNHVLDLVTGVLVLQGDRGPKFDRAARELRSVDHFGAAELVLELGDLGFVKSLRLLGGMVFSIF